jgi:predicted dehydrogenase
VRQQHTPASLDSGRPLRIAVVGSGIGIEHIRGFQQLPNLFEVTALCDVNRKRAVSVGEEHGIRQWTDDFSEVCRSPDIDVIDICTPPHLHREQVQCALEAAKHVICEKPLAGNLAAIDSISALARKTRRQVMPIFQYRFGRGLQKLKYLVDHQLTGDAFVFNVDVAWWRTSTYYKNPWRGKRATEMGGALLSQAIHAVDLVLYVLGPAQSVFGWIATRVNQIEVEDCAAMSVVMKDGSLGTISVTLGSQAEISRHRFTFRNVTAESNPEPYSNSLEPWTFSFKASENQKKIEAAVARFEPGPELYAGQFCRFHEALRTATELPVTLADARAALELVLATYRSSEQQAPINLPI